MSNIIDLEITNIVSIPPPIGAELEDLRKIGGLGIITIYSAPTGFGKTERFLQLAHLDKIRTVIVVRTLRLAEELKERLEILGTPTTVIYGLANVKKPDFDYLCPKYFSKPLIKFLIDAGMFAGYVCKNCMFGEQNGDNKPKKRDNSCGYRQQFKTADNIIIVTLSHLLTDIVKTFEAEMLVLDDCITDLIQMPDWNKIEKWYSAWLEYQNEYNFDNEHVLKPTVIEFFDYYSDPGVDTLNMQKYFTIAMDFILCSCASANDFSKLNRNMLLDPQFLPERLAYYREFGASDYSKPVLDQVIKTKAQADYNTRKDGDKLLKVFATDATPNKMIIETRLAKMETNIKIEYINKLITETATKFFYKIDSIKGIDGEKDLGYTKKTVLSKDWCGKLYHRLVAIIREHWHKPYPPKVGLTTFKHALKNYKNKDGILIKTNYLMDCFNNLILNGIIDPDLQTCSYGSLKGLNNMLGRDIGFAIGTYNERDTGLIKKYQFSMSRKPDNSTVSRNPKYGNIYSDSNLEQFSREDRDSNAIQAIGRFRLYTQNVLLFCFCYIPESLEKTFEIRHIIVKFDKIMGDETLYKVESAQDKTNYIDNIIKEYAEKNIILTINKLNNLLIVEYDIEQRQAYNIVSEFINSNKNKIELYNADTIGGTKGIRYNVDSKYR